MPKTLIRGFPAHGVDAVLTAIVEAATSLGYEAVREAFPSAVPGLVMEGVRVETGRRTLTTTVRQVEGGTVVALQGGVFGGSKTIRQGQEIFDRVSQILSAEAHRTTS